MAVNWKEELSNSVMRKDGNESVGVLVYPPRLDEHAQINTIHFYINGVDDVGFGGGNSGSQRLATKGDSIMQRAVTGFGQITDSINDSLSSLSAAIESRGYGLVGDTFSGLGKIGSDVMDEYHSDGFDVNKFMSGAADSVNLKSKIRRLKTHIVMPMPEDGVAAKYGINYESANMGTLGALGNAMASGQSMGDFAKSSGSAATRAALGGVVGYAGDKAIGGVKAVGDPNAVLSAATRQTLNPRKEQLFTGVDYREFSYHFTLTPATPEECKTVRNIIHTLKKHALPALELNGFYYKYPSEFQIEYYYEGVKNKWLNNIAACALTNLSIHYGSGGWSTLVNGSPTTISLRLHFLELEPLTRNRVEESKF
jgi:hypothetical protein